MALRLASSAKGLSEIEFRERFGSEEQCRSIASMRWRTGSAVRPAVMKVMPYGHWQCNRCKKRHGGHDLHHAAAAIWFLAISVGISSVELGRRLGVRQGTAWSRKS